NNNLSASPRAWSRRFCLRGR
nr:c-mil proto-oncogene exon E7a product [human, Peptide Partial, 20 aa] [Homo sapiens]